MINIPALDGSYRETYDGGIEPGRLPINNLPVTLGPGGPTDGKSVMATVDEKDVQVLRKIADDIDTLNLNDHGFLAGFESPGPGHNQSRGRKGWGLPPLLTLCAQGIQAVADKSVADRFALVDALLDALSAAETVLGTGSGDEKVAEAATALAGVLGPDAKAVDDAVPVVLSMDDVAALLVQAEPDDIEELEKIAGALTVIKDDPNTCPAGRTRIGRGGRSAGDPDQQ